MSDQRKRLPYFNFYPADFLEGTAFMSDEEVGAYIRLLAIQWGHRRLPDDPMRVERMVPSIAKTWPAIASKFSRDGDGMFNERLESERLKAETRADKNAENGRKGGAAKRSLSERYGDRVGDRLANGQAIGVTYQSQSQSQSQMSEAHIPNAAHSVAPTRAAKPSRSKPNDTIAWSPEDGWQGITDADRSAWAKAYPACNADRQLAAADQWLRANPKRATKSRWRAFVINWLSRSQDRGGDERAAGAPYRPTQPKPTIEQKAAALADVLRNAPSRRTT